MERRDPGNDQNDTKSRVGRRGRHAVTLLLLLAVIITGALAYYSRQQWWEMYMGLTR